MIEGEMGKSLGSVGDLIHAPCVGADGEDEACAEGVRRAQEIAEIDGLRHASMPMAKYRGRSLAGLHGSFMP
jgi:hypothetical protein